MIIAKIKNWYSTDSFGFWVNVVAVDNKGETHSAVTFITNLSQLDSLVGTTQEVCITC